MGDDPSHIIVQSSITQSTNHSITQCQGAGVSVGAPGRMVIGTSKAGKAPASTFLMSSSRKT
jgi:hypothetical protein